MTILPIQFKEIVSLYNKITKGNTSELSEKSNALQDIVSISEEARKKEMIERIRNEAIKRNGEKK